jgi:hypothetical protein
MGMKGREGREKKSMGMKEREVEEEYGNKGKKEKSMGMKGGRRRVWE